jgi:predicted ATPase
MITSVEISNFKSLKHVALETRNLNLLTGLNGSGKSTLIQAFLLLKQSPVGQGQLRLRNAVDRIFDDRNLFDAGVAEDIYYQFGVDKEIKVILSTSRELRLGWHFACDPLLEPGATVLNAPERYTSDDLLKWSLFTYSFQYLQAERTGPQDRYTKNPEVVEEQLGLGSLGQYAVHFLHRYGDELKVTHEALKHPRAKSELLIHQADAWMSEIAPGVQLYTEEISNEEVRLSFQFATERGKTNRLKPKNVGFGLTYVLPVIVALLTATPDKLILIENPESHIHPRGQVELGRLLAGCAQSGAQLFVETHSDHILNGLRLAVKEGLIDANKAIAFFFKRNDEDNASQITPIVVDTNGKLHRQTVDGTVSQLPKGFFDQWTSSMAKLF